MLPAISVHNLGKMYRLSHLTGRTSSFRDAITSVFMSPWRRLRQLQGTDETQEEFWALKDLSFDIKPGEVVGIMGRNGAGKSTLLKILSRIVEPTSGEIRLRGRVASLLEVGTGFHPELTGRENIYLNGSILGMKKREINRKFDEIVDFAEVEKFLDTPVKRYSSGMYVRLAFAVAAHLDPEILIVDEVLAVGDAEFQKKCLGKMKEVSTGTGRTVLFVSHSMAAICSLCDRALMLKAGRVYADSSAREVADVYLQSVENEPLSHEKHLTKPKDATYWVEKVRFLVDGRPAAVVPMGSSFSVELDLRANIPIRNPKFLLFISGEDSQPLLQVSNRYSDETLCDNSISEGTISVSFGTLPLCAGRYSISLHVGDTKSTQQTIDEVSWIQVDPRGVGGTSRMPHKGNGAVWLPSRFTIAHSEESTRSQS